MQFPVLSVIVFTPVVFGALIFLIPKERKTEIRMAALAAAFIAMVLAVWVYFSYDPAVGGYQFVERYQWMPALGISYYVGVDGISAPLVLLTGVVMFTGVLISWGIDDRPREFFAFLFILATGVLGVFVALDLFGLFFFYEIAVFPMYLLIAIWGWKVTREYAAMKLTLYLFMGSVISLVGALAMYFGSGMETFNMLALETADFSVAFQRFWFPFVFMGFAVLGGIFPFHNWSPDGHVAAPTAVSMFHAGVLMKLGAFAALRVGIMLLPEGAKFWMPVVIILALVNVVYGAFIALVQSDFKYVIGFSSVSHMGLVMMGFATLSAEGLTGAGVQMFSHGIMTALFFAVVGMVYDRAHTREIPKLGGFSKIMPWLTVAFIIGGMVSMGMPGFSGFIAEFPIFMGVWKTQPWIAIVAAISIVITAAYVLRIIGRVFFGKMPEEFVGHITKINALDKLALGLLSAILIIVGVYPSIMVPLVESGVKNIMRLLGGA
ncbi:MAG: NADH-quinone oxidoreductase subunit M [Anaerolineales bacterium]|jgi:NADH-quinone oxidoreductase subunit M|nr:NADH-quinone oxidoreductase subunit M [Anaerolineales bacterium]